jgi:hypothetical protein
MGRKVGSQNKANQELRLVVAKLVDDNSQKFQGWLDMIEQDHGPLEAFKRIEALLEFCIPKLARTELAGDKKNPVAVADVTDIKSKILKAIPDDQINAILATGNNDGGSDSGTA